MNKNPYILILFCVLLFLPNVQLSRAREIKKLDNCQKESGLKFHVNKICFYLSQKYTVINFFVWTAIFKCAKSLKKPSFETCFLRRTLYYKFLLGFSKKSLVYLYKIFSFWLAEFVTRGIMALHFCRPTV